MYRSYNVPSEPSSSLDLFLLQLISTGIDTPYLLREDAHLSLGATIPALKRMEFQGLVSRQTKQARNKQQFALTTKGKRHLSLQLTALLTEYVERPPIEIESLLRAVALACAQLKPDQVSAMLDAASKERSKRKASIRKVGSVDLKRVDDSYRYFLGRVASARLDAEASALIDLAKFLSCQLVGKTTPPKIVFLKELKRS